MLSVASDSENAVIDNVNKFIFSLPAFACD